MPSNAGVTPSPSNALASSATLSAASGLPASFAAYNTAPATGGKISTEARMLRPDGEERTRGFLQSRMLARRQVGQLRQDRSHVGDAGEGEHKQTDGLLTALPGEWWNGFVKAELDIGSKAKLTVIGTPLRMADNDSRRAGIRQHFR